MRHDFLKKQQEIFKFIGQGRCQHLYLDFGTNIGVQIRKLYEPFYFPDANVLQIFSEVFSNADPKSICVVGFEPNKAMKDRLQELESSYREVGFPCTIFTEVAVYGEDKVLTFYRDNTAAPENHEWGSSLVKWKKNMTSSSYDVLAIHTCNFVHSLLHKQVAHRELQRGAE